MEVILDIETDSLNPTRVWCIVCKDIETGDIHVFREPDLEPEPFITFSRNVSMFIGHNLLTFDLPILHRLVRGSDEVLLPGRVIDTLVVSRLVDY